MEDLSELVSFLADPKPEVRRVAVQHVLAYTADDAGATALQSTNAIALLCKLVGDSFSIAHDAVSALINLSQRRVNCQAMSRTSLASALLEGLADKENKLVELHLMLLSNLTREKDGAEAVLSKMPGARGESLMGVLVGLLCRGGPAVGTGKKEKDPFKWVATVLNNMTQVKAGRMLLLHPSYGHIKRLLPFFRHPTTLRRGGVIGAVRNCCHEWESHTYLLEDAAVLPHFMYPLVGKGNFDEEDRMSMPTMIRAAIGSKYLREPDAEIRTMCVEALRLLTYHRDGRDLMRAKGVYAVVREAHLEEEDERASNEMHELVTPLKGFFDELDESEQPPEQFREPPKPDADAATAAADAAAEDAADDVD